MDSTSTINVSQEQDEIQPSHRRQASQRTLPDFQTIPLKGSETDVEIEDEEEVDQPTEDTSLWANLCAFLKLPNEQSKSIVLDVLKASVSYIIGYILSFSMTIIRIMPGGTALIPIGALIYHPVRTVGGMMELAIVGVVGSFAALGIGCLAELLVVSYNSGGVDRNGAWIYALFSFFCLAIFSYFKVAYPRVTPAATTIYILVVFGFSVGSTHTVFNFKRYENVIWPLLLSLVVAVITNLLVMPVTAHGLFKKAFVELIHALRQDLKVIAGGFLDVRSGAGAIASEKSERARIDGLVTKLKKLQHEMNFEVVHGHIHPKELIRMVQEVKKLSQYISGMRSAIRAKNLLYKRGPKLVKASTDTLNRMHTRSHSTSSVTMSHARSRSTSSVFFSQEEMRSRADSSHTVPSLIPLDNIGSVFKETPEVTLGGAGTLTRCKDGVPLSQIQSEEMMAKGRVFQMLLETFDEPMRELSDSCLEVLSEIINIMSCDDPTKYYEDVQDLEQELIGKINHFERDHWANIKRFYEDESHQELAAPRDESLLLFYFAFSLREFTRTLIRITSRLSDSLSKSQSRGRKKFYFPPYSSPQDVDAALTPDAVTNSAQTLRKYLAIPDPLAPEKPGIGDRVRWFIDRVGKELSTASTRFAIKISIATMLLLLPSWIPATARWYLDVRGAWAAIATVIVMTPTVGGSFLFSVYRFFGTFGGALTAYLVTISVPQNPYWYTAATFLTCTPWWYFLLRTPHVRLGLTFLLTYPIVLLPYYNIVVLNNNPFNDTILTVAVKRFVATVVGLLVAMVSTQLIWPFVAHTELRYSVGHTVHFLGLVYSKLTSLLLTNVSIATEERAHLRKLLSEARRAIRRHNELIHFASMELRIRGPFPKRIYTQINASCRNLLDHYQSLFILCEAGLGSPVLEQLVYPTNFLRKDMYAAILLYYHILSGCLTTKSPLPPYMPDAKSARLKVVAALQELPILQNQTFVSNPEDHFKYLYFYAYALGMREVIHEIERLAALVKMIVGEDVMVKPIFEETHIPEICVVSN